MAVRPSSPVARAQHYLWIAFLFSVFVNLLMLTGPLFMLQVYDRVLAARSEETLVVLILLVVGLYGLMWLLDLARSQILARYGARLRGELDDDVFRASLRMRAKGGSVGRAEQDLDTVHGVFGSPAVTAILDTPFTPIFVLAIFLFHPVLGWLAVAGGMVLIVLACANQLLTRKRSAAAHALGDDALAFGDSVRRGAELILSQGMMGHVTRRWRSKRSEALAASMQTMDWSGSLTTLSKSFRLTLQSLMLALGAWLVLQEELTAGAMIAASILLGRALAPIEQVLARWPQIERARQSWGFLVRLLADGKEPSEGIALNRPDARLEVTGVTVTAKGRKAPMLFNVTFGVGPGEAVGVIGRSGSGKTTLSRVLLDLVRPVSGEVRLGGALLSQYGADALGQHIGFMPQDPVLIEGTIAENIARMQVQPDSAAVIAAATRAGVHDLILSLPQGYDTPVEQGTRMLSGGQRQRIALARVLYRDPVLMVFDEPNSALDHEGTEAFNAAVREMKVAGRAAVIMTHRPMAISECDRLIVMDHGRITAQGPRDEVLKSMMRNAGDIEQGLQKRAVK